MKTVVFYDSMTGNTKRMGEIIASGMNSVDGAEAKAFHVNDFDKEWALESKVIILGTPIYSASISAATKIFLDGPFRGCKPVNKLGGAFATQDHLDGGGNLGIRTILDHMMVYGMLTYSGGGYSGYPVVHLGPMALSGHLEEYDEFFYLYGARMAKKGLELFEK